MGKNVSLFILVVFLFALTSSAFNGFLGIYIKDVGFDESVVGKLLSLRRLAVGISAIIMAILGGRFGRKKALFFGVILMIIGSYGIVSTKNLNLMRLMSVVFGIGQSTIMTFESPFMFANTTKEIRVHAFSAGFAARNAAFMMGSLITGFLADVFTSMFKVEYLGVRYALYVLSAMTVIALLPLSMVKDDSHNRGAALKFGNILGVLNQKLIVCLIYTLFVGFGAGMVVPFFGVYLKYSLDLLDGTVGTILAIAQLGTVFGGLMVPLIAKKFGKTNTIVGVQLASIPFLVMIGLPKNIILVTIAFFFRSSLMNMAQPLIQNLYMDIVDDQHRPLVSALRSTVNNIARAGGILLGGYMMQNISYGSPYVITIICYIIGMLLFRWNFRKTVDEEKKVGTVL